MSTTPSYKPASYNSVSPYLVVTNAAATIQFLKDVFGGEELRRMPDPKRENRLMHAEVRLDDTVIMLGDCIEGGWPAVEAHVHVYVPDVDATYAKALACGATGVQEPVQKDDEDKRGGFKDAGGTTWWVGTKVD
ncbi:putative glyoxalase superfamily protein PhnB [Prosthecobacter fusiformis]|uniref:Putative glyoxalase superfamily protein PhnB n=1 Tax=Prosthecobacter fusiformis TaxID=48464 RepID=A0A4R7RLC3_9BACT|nr:VOC family protein [Prosthecobacter fusiformis]TDU66072.1 putative glyoxalase superfamily protein PhnB [Prosthecobacter fusiformis]